MSAGAASAQAAASPRYLLDVNDLPALSSQPKTSEQVTDQCLADLAAQHGARLGTFDQAIKHSAVDVIA